MASSNAHTSSAAIWELARRHHGVVTRRQLLALGLHPHAIFHRVKTGRLHPVARGVYAVGRPELSRHGRWTAAVMSCGAEAVLSHQSAAVLWGFRAREGLRIDVTIPPRLSRSRPGLKVYRRKLEPTVLTELHRIPVTTVHQTLIDLALVLGRDSLEAAINDADKHDLTDPESLRAALVAHAGQPGVVALRQVLDRRTFTLTDSRLERLFLPIARRAGMPKPQTGVRLNGFKVDFYWPEMGLVVETDGLRYHRTPAQQARDRLRDQAHTAAGLTTLRFTRAQVRFEPGYVQTTLAAVVGRIQARMSD